MSVRRALEIVLVATALLVAASLVLGFVLGQPVALSYVETGSMEPTIDEGDGFVAIPSPVAGPIEEGDVIVYDAQEVDGGGLTTHRVVGATDHGYVTRGDANAVTDQDGAEPHVTDGQVVATALQVHGEVVTIPHLGTAVAGVQSGLEAAQLRLAGILGTGAVLGSRGLSYLLLGFGLVVILAGLVGGVSRVRTRARSRSRSDVFDARTLVLGTAVVLCLVSVVTMASMSATTEFGVVSSEYDSGASHVIPAGETDEQTYELRNGGALPVVSITEPASSGVAVDEEPTRLDRGGATNATVEVTTPPETGYYLYSFVDYRYFAVLPTPVIAALHAVHPWIATAAVTGVVVSVFTLPFALLVGTGRIRTRERRRSGRQHTFLRRLR